MRAILRIFALFTVCLFMFACTNAQADNKGKGTVIGLERIKETKTFDRLKGKRVGVFTNQTGVDRNMRTSTDVLRDYFNVTAIFTPEHGLEGVVKAGEKVGDSSYKNIPVISLYGKSRRPSKEMLDRVDAIVVDIQDVGVRHYTYISSVAYLLEECAKYKKKIVILDRPNPLGGVMQGPVIKPENLTFIGIAEIPLRHGLTMGEFALFYNGEQKINCDLEVVKMKNWKRNMLWRDTGLPWVQTSPHIPTADTAIAYCVMGFCGDAGIDNGVGTTKPFAFAGATWADGEKIKNFLDDLKIKGVAWRKATYAKNISNNAVFQGVEFFVNDPINVNLPELGYQITNSFRTLYPTKFTDFPRSPYDKKYRLLKSLGEDSVLKNEKPAAVFKRWTKECEDFRAKSEPYLLYK